jgi:hypothetical protein
MAEGMEAGGGGNALPRRAGTPRLTLGPEATLRLWLAQRELHPAPTSSFSNRS